MPHIKIKLWKGKSEEQKKELANELVKASMAVIGYGSESFSVAIEDVEPDDWKEKVYLPDIKGNSENIYKEPGYSMD